MNHVVDEINVLLAEDELLHYGIKRRSGRYPWGSGEDPYQHGSQDFLSRVEELKKQGWKETTANIREEFGMTSNQFRTEKSIASNERRALNVATAKSLREDGLSASEIGRRLGVNESTVRSWFNEKSEIRMNQAQKTASFIKEQVDKKGMVDVGKGVEKELRVSKEKLKDALYLLEKEGYVVYEGGIPQATNPGHQTTQKVICKPGTQHKEIYDFERVHSLTDYISRDGGDTFEKKFEYPASMDSKRMQVRYKEDGGADKDGIVELRRNVPDLSLGESRYAQVRILVDGTHYIKGVAVYSDDMPKGVDVIFNTNKTKDVPKMDVLKKIKDDPDNPFGSLIKDADQGGQYKYIDKKTGEKKLGLINKRADEGDWDEWSNGLPSQFLGKQSKTMAKKQLDLAKANRMAEYEEICSLSNPTIKKHFLKEFADSCDAASVHLKAAALPGQKYHVIVPVNTLKDNEVFAPNYENGTKLALIRYPHGGTFEIPILTVNNKHQPAKDLLGANVVDAVGINSKNAERLSGADFDGDTVMCIPTHDRQGKVKIISKPLLKGLEGFDPKHEYGHTDKSTDADGTVHYYQNGREFKAMTKKGTQVQMGIISNLITDMTLGGAGENELAAAVRHSMVVIDAEKHKLNYRQSELDNNIAALKKKWQPKEDGGSGGASTILSKAKGEYDVPKRQGSPYINLKDSPYYDPSRPEGALVYKTADAHNLYKPVRSVNKNTGIITLTTVDGRKVKYDPNNKAEADEFRPIKKVDKEAKTVTYTNKKGDIVYAMEAKTQKSTNMAETDDAFTLVSPLKHPMEIIYAEYANSMKAMANQARIELANTGKIAYSKTAKKEYAKEVESLNEKLTKAQLNSPRERAAQRMTNAQVNAKIAARKASNEEMDSGEIKKARQQALTANRQAVGHVSRRNRNIEITDREWEAIQKGAITETKLTQILSNADTDKLRQRAMPKTSVAISEARVQQMKAMEGTYTLQQIADKFNLSTSTVSKYLRGKE